MAAPARVPVDPTRPKHYSSPPRRSGWTADRPGETIGAPHPSGPALGNQGPDQGYLLTLAGAVSDEIVVAPGEHVADVIEGCCAVALRRASLFGRAPVAGDLRLALAAFGFLGEADPELVAFRRELFAELHHSTIHYFGARKVADLVPEETLRKSQTAVAQASSRRWQGPLGL